MPQHDRLDLRGIGWFLAIAFGLAWLLELPMFLSAEGLRSSWAQLITLANLTPAVATFVVARWIRPHADVDAGWGALTGQGGEGARLAGARPAGTALHPRIRLLATAGGPIPR